MRSFLWVILIVLAMLGGYEALLPLTAPADVKTAVSGTGPF